MSNCFHLAVEGGKLELTLPFYTTILGCELGPSEEGKWHGCSMCTAFRCTFTMGNLY